MVALASYAVVAFDEPADGGKRVAPSEFRLFHSGVNHTSKGDFLFDDVAAKSVMDAYAARNGSVPLMGDYEHQSLATPPMKALASATQFVPAIRRDAQGGPELWATQVQWTEDARHELELGQYRLYSPAFVPSKDGRIAALSNFALTNLPASYEIAPLVAASATTTTKEPPMDEDLKKLTEKLTSAEKDRDELKSLCEKMKALVAKRLGKSFDDWAKEEDQEDAHKEEAKAKLTALKAVESKILELTGKTEATEALGVLALSMSQSKELVALKAKLADDTAKALEAEFTATLDGAVAAGKLPPAGTMGKEFFVGLKADFGTEKALSALKKAIPTEPIIQLRAPNEAKPDVALTQAEAAVSTMVGLPLAELQKFKESQRAGTAV